jgi:hypothetical protein
MYILENIIIFFISINNLKLLLVIILPLIMYLRSLGSESIVCNAIKSSAGLTGGFEFE